MNTIKKLNEIFGYGLLAVGILKAILIFLIFIQMVTGIMAIFAGGMVDAQYYSGFSTAIGFAQIILAIGSIIMIILNLKKQPKIVIWYLWGILAILIEFIVPTTLYIFVALAECGMYIKAGAKIRSNNIDIGIDKNYKKVKQDIKNTEWFYNDDK